MFCNYCGKQLPDDAQLCAYCGKHVAGAVARKRLVRPREGRKIAGVCIGFAEYFDLDVTLVRIVWLVCSLFGLLGVVAYAAGWIVMPEAPLALNSAPAAPVGPVGPDANKVVNM
jgi:phage shock protein C